MALILGIDTSNYSTSCAVFNTQTLEVKKLTKLLPVKEGERGIRQSDAVFHHTVQLPELLEELLSCTCEESISAVCASVTPRPEEGSYMPCFLVGKSIARSISCALGVPYYETSHQQGHIMAALYSADKCSLLSNPFLAFHISGGTTEGVLITPSDKDLFDCKIVARTLDLNAGQLIDRIGVKMGIKFPCGKELEKLARNFYEPIKVKAVMKGFDCCLSGFENKLTDMINAGEPQDKISAYTLAYVDTTVSAMTEGLLREYGNLPLIYAGGVMSDSIIRKSLEEKFGASFARPDFSCDNAAGVAVIGGYKFLSEQKL
ncbi:MAG: peptidase M22 [Ruminococcus sp.]